MRFAVDACAHDGAADKRAAAPYDLDEAHVIGAAAEMLQGHQREHHPDGHDEEEHEDRQREEPCHSRYGGDGAESLAELPPKIRFERAPHGIGDAYEQQRGAGDDGARDVQKQDIADAREADEHGSQCRADDVRQRIDDLVDTRHPGQLGFGSQQRHGSLHRGGMEGRSHRAAGQQDVDMPHLRHVEPEKHGQDKRAERDEAVGQDHRAFAIPSVDVDPDDRAQQRLGQHTRNCCQRQYLGRTGLDAHPEDDRIADDRAAEDRGELPAPDDPECLFPVFHACFAVMPKKADTEVSAAANPSVKGFI